MTILAFSVHFLLLLIVPVAVGFWLNQRLKLTWRLFFGGALAFIASWIITNFIPLPWQLGYLVSAILQTTALYLIYRFQFRTVNTEREALMVGLGQGGIELILIGLLTALSFVQMLPLRDASDQRLTELTASWQDISEEKVDAQEVSDLRELIDEYWATPWYVPLLQSLQYLVTLPVQIILAIIVLRAWVQNTLSPLLTAIAIDFLYRVLTIYALILGGSAAGFGVALLFGAGALWFLHQLWPTIQKQTTGASLT